MENVTVTPARSWFSSTTSPLTVAHWPSRLTPISLSTGALGGGSGPTRTVFTVGSLSPSLLSTAITATE